MCKFVRAGRLTKLCYIDSIKHGAFLPSEIFFRKEDSFGEGENFSGILLVHY